MSLLSLFAGRTSRKKLSGAFAAIGTVAFAATAGIGALPAEAAPAPPHIMVIVLENTDYSQMLGSNSMPYLNELAAQYTSFNAMYGLTGDSLPNYLELLSGTANGITGDCDIQESLSGSTETPCAGVPFTNQTVTDQLNTAGIGWNAYFEDDASGCDQTDGGGNYAYWHNPFRYFSDFSTLCPNLSNFATLNSNLNSASPAPFQWVVPDLINDGGDSGTMSSADTWLLLELPQIMASNWYQQGGQVIITWDSGYNSGTDPANSAFKGGHEPTVVVSGAAYGGGVNTTPVDAASVLHSVESAYGLSFLADAALTINNSLGNAVVAGLPAPAPASQYFDGAVLNTTGSLPGTVTTTSATALNLTGIAEPLGGNAGDPTTAIEVGEGANDEGVIVTPANGAVAVPGTNNLEGVACATASQCYAVGLFTSNADSSSEAYAVLVSIVNGQAVSVTDLPSFIGLYGIACPSATTCYAVGYDTADAQDAITTITNGSAGAPVEVGSVEWLNAITCTSSTQCYAAGLDNYEPTIVPVVGGAPGTPVQFKSDRYMNGIACTSTGNCLGAGENKNQQGVIMPLVSGAAGTVVTVAGTEYLYGVACAADGDCLLAGASTPGSNGYSTGVVSDYTGGTAQTPQPIAGTNGFGQAICGAAITNCLSVGASVASGLGSPLPESPLTVGLLVIGLASLGSVLFLTWRRRRATPSGAF